MTDTDRSGSRARVGAARKPAHPRWGKKFLDHLATTSNVTESAKKAKICSTTAYQTRRGNGEFGRAWQAALLEGYEHLEMELLERLRAGEVKPTAAAKRGKRSFDNGTAFRLLSLHRETVARQRAIQDDEDEEAVLAALDAKLDRMRQRQLDDDEGDESGQGDEGHTDNRSDEGDDAA